MRLWRSKTVHDQQTFEKWVADAEAAIRSDWPDFPSAPRPLPRYGSELCRSVIECLMAVIYAQLGHKTEALDAFAKAEEWCA